MRAGCSIRLSTPPRLSASVQTLRARDAASTRLLARPRRRKRHHAAEVAHLPRRDRRGPGCVGQARVEHALDPRVPAQAARRRARAFVAVPLHAHRERLERRAARASGRTGRARRRATSAGSASRSAIVGSFVTGEAADDVGVAAEVLRRRVHDDVGAERERLLQVRRRERVVDDERARRRACAASATARDVDDVEQRVRRRLDPDERACARRGAPATLGRARPASTYVEPVALRLVHLREHAVRAAVDVVHADDVVAGVDEVHDRRRRAESRTRTRGRARPPSSEARHSSSAVRVGLRDARVVVALVDADRLLRERRGLVDRRRSPRPWRDRAPGRRGSRASRSP